MSTPDEIKTLDDLKTIQQVDEHRMLDLIQGFSDQIKEAEKIGLQAELDSKLSKGITRIVFTGLGGSAIGADVVRSYLTYELEVPIFVNRHYRLPKFVDRSTLLIASSYSGDTEETLSSLKEGLASGTRIFGISSGGTLASEAKKRGFPLIQIPKGFPPRAALGYSVFPLLIALSKLGFKRAYRPEEFKETQELVARLAVSEYGVNVPFKQNKAKQFAASCFKHYPIVYAGADFFDVVALRWRGQIEENAKALASHHVLPEMNHNELVGWKFPEAFLKETVVVMLRDRADHKRVQKRMNLVRGIVEPLCYEYLEPEARGTGLLARMFSLIHLGDWVSFYLAVLNRIDPTPVKVIQYLKSELAKEPA